MKILSGKAFWPLLLLVFIGPTPVFSQNSAPKRIALVIGSQNYTVLPKLRNSLSDAGAISTTLEAKGFQVKSLYDPKTRTEIKDGINWYFNQMRDQEGAVGLIFYAGHGMQYQGENYIIPTTATLRDPSDLEDYCVKMNTIIAILNSATSSLNILLLDACRSLPSFTRGMEQGLTKMDAPQGSIIVFATQPGKVASDGTGIHGLFTSNLLAAVNEPNLNINEVFQRVKREVFAESKKDQLPSIEDNAVGGDFFFTPGSQMARTNQPVLQPELKSESVYKEPETVRFDYGYGPSDAATVTVGSQTWITKNLNVDHFANGDPIAEAKTAEEWKRASHNLTPAWCYFDNDPTNGRRYGRLYNWYAVDDPRGLAPKGWHVPSDAEWTAITDYLGGEATAGTQLKSTSLWADYKGANGNGNNKTGIAGLPGGFRLTDGTFFNMGKYGYWWSSTEVIPGRAWFRCLYYNSGNVFRIKYREGCGYSVRCVRD